MSTDSLYFDSPAFDKNDTSWHKKPQKKEGKYPQKKFRKGNNSKRKKR